KTMTSMIGRMTPTFKPETTISVFIAISPPPGEKNEITLSQRLHCLNHDDIASGTPTLHEFDIIILSP
ncbi:hypothetical protein P3584_20925, partial [Vibrio parahaemolyticus]|nr:hypothetical protein [Vibrio parahaemolyticus]MDG3397320.1 hypothetical protein [Vibrio parahaemolyticus]